MASMNLVGSSNYSSNSFYSQANNDQLGFRFKVYMDDQQTDLKLFKLPLTHITLEAVNSKVFRHFKIKSESEQSNQPDIAYKY